MQLALQPEKLLNCDVSNVPLLYWKKIKSHLETERITDFIKK